MHIRDWKPEDMRALAEFHREMAVGYDLPASFGPLFAVRKALVDDSGRVIGMAAVKIVGEAMIWLDPGLSVRKNAKTVLMLHEECRKSALALGFDEVSAWIPERIAQCFSKMLEKLGWRRSRWHSWGFSLK